MKFRYTSIDSHLHGSMVDCLLNITFVSSHSSYNMYIHIYYTPVSGVFCPLGRPFLAFQALSANIYLHSSEVFYCSFLRLSHYGSSEVFCCPLVCIITTYRQYRSILLTLSPKFLSFFLCMGDFCKIPHPTQFCFYI